jgi:hypothetical protein
MADNVAITAGSGTDISTDELAGGEHVQHMKLMDGTADSDTVIASGGGVEAGALRVTIASDSTGLISIDDGGNTITVDGTVDLGATDNAVLDDIKAAVETLDNAIDGTEMQVDIVAALPAGDNNIGIVDTPIATPTIYNKTLASADTEYSQALPSNIRYFEFQCLTAYDVRFAFESGKVATPTSPYMTLKGNGYYYSPQINQGASPSTIYLASSEAGVEVQILAWV